MVPYAIKILAICRTFRSRVLCELGREDHRVALSTLNSIFKSALRGCVRAGSKVPSAVPRRHDLQNHDGGDIAEASARSPLTGSARWKAMLSSTGAAINTSHVTLIAATSNR